MHKQYKVISPIERNGTTWWARCGNAFKNRDESLNVYLDCIPAARDGQIKLQIRELTEEELRERAEKRASYADRAGSAAPSTSSPSGLPF